VRSRALQLAMSVATAVAGVLLALVLAPGTETAALGWVLAVLGVLGTLTTSLLPQPGRRGGGTTGPR
jgi:hypothetical protein